MNKQNQLSDSVRFAWTPLPNKVKTIILRYIFTGACSTYLFAPGKQIDCSRNFAVTNSDHINILHTSKENWRDGRHTYFRTARIVFRGYEKIMNDSIGSMHSLVQTVEELCVPLHFVRWMLMRGNLRHFRSLTRLLMEDMSVRGFEIEGDNPGPGEILTALYKKETEISKIHELLVDPSSHSGASRDDQRAIEVLFQFEVFNNQHGTAPSSTSQIASESSRLRHPQRRSGPPHGNHTISNHSPSIATPIHSISVSKLRVRHGGKDPL